MKKKRKENKENKLFLNNEKLLLLLEQQTADTQAELEAQSAIPSDGKESRKESADSAKPQSDGAFNEVIK